MNVGPQLLRSVHVNRQKELFILISCLHPPDCSPVDEELTSTEVVLFLSCLKGTGQAATVGNVFGDGQLPVDRLSRKWQAIKLLDHLLGQLLEVC